MNIIETIDSIQERIFSYDIKETGKMLTGLIEMLASLLPGLDPERLQKFNGMLGKMMDAMQNEDYLLVADVLQYDVKPFIRGSLS